MTGDPINPEHYKSKGLELIDVIEAFDLDYFEATIVCYVVRRRRKKGLEDLQKAQWYLNRLIANEEALLKGKPTEAPPCPMPLPDTAPAVFPSPFPSIFPYPERPETWR